MKTLLVCTDTAVPLADKTKGIVFEKVNEDKTRGDRHVYAYKKFRQATVGHVYTLEIEGGSCFPDSLRYVGPWPDKEERMTWEAVGMVRRAEDDRKKALLSAKNKTLIAKQLEPLYFAIKRLDYYNRREFENVVIQFLRAGKI